MVRVPRCQHGGQTRNPAQWLSAATLAMNLPTHIMNIPTARSSPTYDVAPELKKIMPRGYFPNFLYGVSALPNFSGMSAYDAMKYMMDAVPKSQANEVAIEFALSEIDKLGRHLSARAGGDFRIQKEWCDSGSNWALLDAILRGGLALNLFQNGRRDAGIENPLREITRMMVADVERVIVWTHAQTLEDQDTEREPDWGPMGREYYPM